MAGNHALQFFVRISMETLFSWLFSGAWAWFLGKIGMSAEEKLGRPEITTTVLTDDLTEKAHEAKVFEVPGARTGGVSLSGLVNEHFGDVASLEILRDSIHAGGCSFRSSLLDSGTAAGAFSHRYL
jgi:hypothetical protein